MQRFRAGLFGRMVRDALLERWAFSGDSALQQVTGLVEGPNKYSTEICGADAIGLCAAPAGLARVIDTSHGASTRGHNV
eukprot:scaffold28754_cov58-Phaeocystis_antarctica.AAC.3